MKSSVSHIIQSIVFHTLVLILIVSPVCHAANAQFLSPPMGLSPEMLEKKLKEAEEYNISKPDDISDQDIAAYLASGEFPPNVPDFRARMWIGPMRVSVEDAQGHDLDLNTYPGSFIKYYLNSLSSHTNLPITITRAENRDNNVSIVAVTGDSTAETPLANAGTLYGVPELANRASEFMNGLITHHNAPVANIELALTGSFNRFIDDHTIKACAMSAIFFSREENIRGLWFGLNLLMQQCLGANSLTITIHKDQAKPISIFSNAHSFYFWKVFYNSGITPGMASETVQAKISQYLKRESQPKQLRDNHE